MILCFFSYWVMYPLHAWISPKWVGSSLRLPAETKRRMGCRSLAWLQQTSDEWVQAQGCDAQSGINSGKDLGAGSKHDGDEQGWEMSEALFSFEMHWERMFLGNYESTGIEGSSQG